MFDDEDEGGGLARGSHRSVGHVAMVLEVGDGDSDVVGEEAVRWGGVVEAAGRLRGEVAGRRLGSRRRNEAEGEASVGVERRRHHLGRDEGRRAEARGDLPIQIERARG